MTDVTQPLLDPSYHPPITWSLPGILAERAAVTPQDECLIDAITDERITYRALQEEAGRLGQGLKGLGLEAGDTIATMITHSIDTYRVWFGLTHIGVLEVPIGIKFKGRLLGHLLEDSGAKAIIIDADFLEVLRPVLQNEPLPDLRWVVVRGASGEVEALDPREVLTLEELRRAGEASADGTDSNPWDRAPHELAMVLYTSGTTGPSKGVLVPWGQVGSVAAGVYPEGTHKDGDVLYCPFPPNHIGGRLLPAVGIRHGLPVVIRETWSASAFWPEIQRYGCTTTAMVSAMANILWRSPASDADADNPITNLLLLPVIDEYEQFEERFGLRICTTFNMTEISIATQSGWGIEDPRSCGKARLGPPGYQLRLVDEHDYPVEVGEVGELVVRTDVPWSLNAGYFGRPQQSAEAWRNGWFHTGDAFKCDEEGRYYFVDRMKDAIRRRGENVSSFEVEREVSDHPDVVECAAIGVPATIGEEDIKVFVVTTPGSELTEAELIEHVGEKCASFMVPSYVEFVDELPKTEATERVKKAELRTHEAGH